MKILKVGELHNMLYKKFIQLDLSFFNDINLFLDKHVVENIESRVQSAILYNAYVEFCLKNNFHVRTIHSFANCLKNLGFKKISYGPAFWLDIELINDKEV